MAQRSIAKRDVTDDRYTGIIRTLPYFGAGDTLEAQAKKKAHERMMKAFRRMARGEDSLVRIAFSVRPKFDVLHCYIIVGGRVWVRANIATWEVGTGEKVESWDGHDLSNAKYWCILTAPVSFPQTPVKMRGFQGLRYVTEPLW